MQNLGIDYDHFDQFKMKLRTLTSDELYHSGKTRATGRMFQVNEPSPSEADRDDGTPDVEDEFQEALMAVVNRFSGRPP